MINCAESPFYNSGFYVTFFRGPRKIQKMMQIYASNLQDSYNLRVAGGFNGNLRTEVCTVPYMYGHILWV